MARKKRTYDDKFRASAVIMLESQGYPDTKGALQRVADHLKVAESTLRGWYNKTSNPPPANIRAEKRLDFKTMLREEIEAALHTMINKREEATYKDLSTSIAIFIDKLQLLEQKPTEISETRHSGQITLTSEQRNSRLTELLDSARTRRNGLPADGTDSTVVH